MAGNITKRGQDRWQVKVFKGRDPVTGKQLVHNKTIRGTKKEAQANLNKDLHERDQGTWVEPSMVSHSSYLDRWLKEADTSTAKNNEHNVWAVEHYIKPAIGHIPLGRLSTLDIQGLYTALQRKGLAASSIRRIHNILSPTLRTAVRWGFIGRNPATDVSLPKVKKKEMKFLNGEQARSFLEFARQDTYRVLWVVALETGMRPEEYMGLRWRDVDLKEGILMLQRALKWMKGGDWHLDDLKSDGARRKLRLSDELRRLLIDHRRAQLEERLAFGKEWQDHDLVFTAEMGKPLRNENLTRRHFKPILSGSGLPDIRLYDLRHTSATLLLLKGVHVKIVSERLGHTDVALTLNTYSHVLPDMQHEAAAAIGHLLHG